MTLVQNHCVLLSRSRSVLFDMSVSFMFVSIISLHSKADLWKKSKNMVNWSPNPVAVKKRSPWVQVVGHAGLLVHLFISVFCQCYCVCVYVFKI